MIESMRLNIMQAHELTYGPKILDEVLNEVTEKGPKGYVALGKDLPTQRNRLMSLDPRFFEAVLNVRKDDTFDSVLARSLNPAFHVGNEGFRAWHRALFIISGYRYSVQVQAIS